MGADRAEKLEEPSPAHKATGKPSHRKFSWLVVLLEVALTLGSGVVSGAVVSWWSVSEQARLDDQRSAREQRTENLRFVRERSTFEEDPGNPVYRPFQGMDLEGQNLSGLRLRVANLVEASLYKAELRGTDLGGALLGKADLREADLERVNLKEANLEGANLAGAHMKQANLFEASLTNVNLTNADLSEADLTVATLAGARLDGANLKGAKLADIEYGQNTVFGTVCYDGATIWPDHYDPPYMDPESCRTR